MEKLFRTFLVIACLLVVVAMLIPAWFGDKRPRVYFAAERGDTNYIADYLASGSNVNALTCKIHRAINFCGFSRGRPESF